MAAARPRIAKAAGLVAEAFGQGGRLFFVGAGTSGRLGVIEAAECPPTFHTKPGQVQAIMAGGKAAVFQSKEGAEDSESEARAALDRMPGQIRAEAKTADLIKEALKQLS